MDDRIEPDDAALEEALRGGDDTAFGSLFENHRVRLTRMVGFRLDPRLVGRIDPEDVLQETFIEAEKRLPAVGWKAGRWIDIGFWHQALGSGTPTEPA